MKKLIFPLLLLCLFFVPLHAHGQALPCGNLATVTAAAAGEQLIATPPTGGHSIEICNVTITATNGASVGNFSIDYGTGSACATGTTTLLPYGAGTASTPMSVVWGSFTSPTVVVPSGQEICINFASAPSIEKVIVLYAIF